MGIVTGPEFTLATAVTSPAGTVAFAYPTGYVQADFTGDFANTVAYMIVNGNDRYEEADDEFDISYGASTVTITNKTGATLPVGTTIQVGLSYAGEEGAFITAAALASLTDSTTGTASDTLAATVGVNTIAIPVQLAAMTTSAADLMSAYTPGYAFELLSVEFITTTLGTGAGASQVLNLEIGTTNVTGGALTLLLADTDTLGKKKAATAITAANTGSASDTISLEVAAGGTVFTAGAGFILLKLRNMDTVNAIASLADKINDTLTRLRSAGVIDAS